MNEAIVLQTKRIIDLWQAQTISKPFAQEIFLLRTFVAGTYFANAGEILAKETALPLKVILRREPKNHYDELAILILTEKGEKLGYLPRKHNEIIARLMDAGKSFAAKITAKDFSEKWLNLELEIFFVEL